jgi:hypothetical protein
VPELYAEFQTLIIDRRRCTVASQFATMVEHGYNKTRRSLGVIADEGQNLFLIVDLSQGKH